MHPRHKLTPLAMKEALTFFEDYISKNTSRAELKRYINKLADEKSPSEALETIDFILELQRDENGESSEPNVIKYGSDFQRQFLGTNHNDQITYIRPQEI